MSNLCSVRKRRHRGKAEMDEIRGERKDTNPKMSWLQLCPGCPRHVRWSVRPEISLSLYANKMKAGSLTHTTLKLIFLDTGHSINNSQGGPCRTLYPWVSDSSVNKIQPCGVEELCTCGQSWKGNVRVLWKASCVRWCFAGADTWRNISLKQTQVKRRSAKQACERTDEGFCTNNTHVLARLTL